LARARLGDQRAALTDFEALPRRVTQLFEWKAGRCVDGNADAAVEVLTLMRAAARGVRRGEQYLDVLWMKR
jgi:hypothetical protein